MHHLSSQNYLTAHDNHLWNHLQHLARSNWQNIIINNQLFKPQEIILKIEQLIQHHPSFLKQKNYIDAFFGIEFQAKEIDVNTQNFYNMILKASDSLLDPITICENLETPQVKQEQFPKTYLTYRSDYLKGMFDHRFQEKSLSSVTIPHQFSVSFIDALKQKPILNENNIQDYFELANYYALSSLRTHCEKWLLEYIDPENTLDLLKKTTNYDLPLFRQTLIQKHIKYLLNTNLFHCLEDFLKLYGNEVFHLNKQTCLDQQENDYWKSTLLDQSTLILFAKHCPNLESIYLNHCPTLTDQGLIILTKNCLKLKTIYLDFCENISSQSIEILLSHCDLKVISLRKFTELNDRLLKTLANSSHLEHLDLTSNQGNVTSEIVLELAKKLFFLKTIHLGECKFIDDAFVRTLAYYHPNLEAVDLGFNSHISASAIIELLEKTHFLHSFSLDTYEPLNDLILKALEKHKESLKSISFSNAFHVTDQAIIDLIKACPYLESITLIGFVDSNKEVIFALANKTNSHLIKSLNLNNSFYCLQTNEIYRLFKHNLFISHKNFSTI